MKALPQTIDNWISGHARFTPEKPAIIFEGRSITYAQLCSQIDQTSAVLAGKLGLKRGDRIAYYGLNRPDMFVLLFAAARLGLILVPFNWRLAVPELRFIARDCAPRLLVVDGRFEKLVPEIVDGLADCRIVSIAEGQDGWPLLSDLQSAVDPGLIDDLAPFGAATSDPLLIVYTSGTTGAPKGAVLTQDAMRCNAMMAQHAYDMTAHDHVLNVLPLFHVGGLAIQPLPALSLGATVTLHEKFVPALAVKSLSEDDITLINTVPTVLQAMVQLEDWAAADLTALRAVSIGSTDVPTELIETIHGRGIPLVQIYGATETGPIAIYQRIDAAFDTVGSIGRTGLYCETRLVDDAGRDVADGENGEIWVRGQNILVGYWNNEDATNANIVDGWFRTGDVASRDADGNFWFADRIKHVIISGGENIYAAELERVLRGHSAIEELSIVGRQDDRWGEVPVAVVVRRDPALTAEDVLSVYQGRLARFKHPKDVVFVDALPRNVMGKVLVDAVRQLAANGGG